MKQYIDIKSVNLTIPNLLSIENCIDGTKRTNLAAYCNPLEHLMMEYSAIIF